MNTADSNQHLRWILASLGLVLVMHLSQLVLWLSFLVIVIGVWRFALTYSRRSLPRKWFILPVVTVATLGILTSYGGLFGPDASVALLMLMTAFKTLESKTVRDMTVMIYLGYFLSICAFLFSQSIPIALFMILPIVTLTAGLIGINHPNGILSVVQKISLSGKMLLQALPVMLIFFVLFPRVPGPLWGSSLSMTRSQTGLSDDMSPGAISELSRSSAPVFRVEFKDQTPSVDSLYWRGPVLWHYDGRTWRAIGREFDAESSYQTLSAPIAYTITLEAHDKHWLFLLDLPVQLPNIGHLTRDFQFFALEPVRQRVRYDASSSLTYRSGTVLSKAERQRALQLPPLGNQRTKRLARQWLEQKQTPQQLIQRVLAMYNNDFVYTLQPPLLGSSAIDEFLFNSKKGFCGHYAGSFVFLMRALGIPARVVTGYQGGEFNPVGNYLLVRQSDAHAWAEVWLQGQGWVRVDPTAAVAPERVQQGIAAALPESEPLPVLVRPGFDWLKRISLNWDAVNNGWNQWVLGYNKQRQLEFLAKLTGSRIDWQDMVLWMMGLLILSVGIIAAFMLRQSLPKNDLALHAWMRMQKKLANAGVSIYAHEGPFDLTHRAAKILFRQQDEILHIGKLYMNVRYGGRSGLAELQRCVKKFQPK